MHPCRYSPANEVCVNLSDYQAAALRTAGLTREPNIRIAVAGMGLAGEAAEVLEVVFSTDHDKLGKELGDVMWYTAETASSFGISLADLTIPDPTDDDDFLEALLRGYAVRLSIHAGTLTDYLKKIVGHGHEPDLDRIAAGLAQVIRDVTDVAGASGLTLDEVCEANIVKLQARYKRGFTSAESINRPQE
jgi:NTP pyrophosphatase (non-canonical NTP hydrolase)